MDARVNEGVTVAFVREMLALDASSMPQATLDKASLCLLDFLSCALAARRYKEPEATIAMASAWPAPSGSPVVASSLRLPPAEAAYVNAVMGAAASRTDMHPAVTAHCAPVIFPVALAIAAQRKTSGLAFLGAVVAGYEAMVRVGRVMVDDRFRRHFRATAVLGAVGGAITAARLLDLPLAQAVDALALSANTASGLMEFGYSGEIDLFFQPANAARNAITSALLAREGVAASATILEGRAGLLAGFGGLSRAGEIVSPREGFEIDGVDFKRVPACVFVQAAAHAAEEIVLRGRVDWQEVEAIRLRTFEAALRYPGCDDPGPIDTLLGARMSLQYAVASVLARGELAEENFTDLGHPGIRALVPRVSVEAGEEYDSSYPARQGARVTVTLRSGRTLEGEVREVPSFGRDGIVARYRRVAAPHFPGTQAEVLEQASLGCARQADMREVVDAIGLAS
ncbi:MAG: MmgE/PrpD family protein [Burkholderiales bacterium]